MIYDIVIKKHRGYALLAFLRMTQGNLHESKDYYGKAIKACDKIGNINAKQKLENQLKSVEFDICVFSFWIASITCGY